MTALTILAAAILALAIAAIVVPLAVEAVFFWIYGK